MCQLYLYCISIITVPSKILLVTKVSAPTSTTLHLSWEPPVPSNGILSNYNIQYNLRNNQNDKFELHLLESKIIVLEDLEQLQPIKSRCVVIIL